jgi:hypothetical protein
VVHIELLAPRERAPGDRAAHVDGERGIVARAALGARPLGGGDYLARLGRDVREGDELLAPFLGKIGQLHAGALLHQLETLDREPAVRGSRERQDRFADLVRTLEFRPTGAHAAAHRAIAALEVLDLLVGFPEVTLGRDADVLDRRAQRLHLLGHGAVVALDDNQPRHRLAGDGFALALLPVEYPA